MSSSGFYSLSILIILGVGVAFFLKKNRKNNPKEPSENLDFFINEIKIYIKNTYPNIVIDYGKIKSLKNDTQLLARDILIIEEIILQFASQKIEMHSNIFIPKEQLWSSYEELSIPIKGKLPKDFLQRKEIVFRKQGGACARCGQKITFSNAMSYLFKSLEEKGTYHFENICVVCSDCNKILTTSQEHSKIISSLNIYDHLLSKINR